MNHLALGENILFVAILLVALVPVLFLFRRRPRIVAAALVVVAVALVLLSLVPRHAEDTVLANAVPEPVVHDGMLPSNTCKGCHPRQYDTWHQSYHRTMTQVAGPDTVVAPFDGRTLLWNGQAWEVNRRGEEFWVKQVGSGDFDAGDDEEQSHRVVMTTGSRHQQIYWLAGENGALRQFDWVWEMAMDRWIPSEHSFLRPPDWQQHAPTWNQDCVRCHSVGPLPGYDAVAETWNTEVTELGIACASCHGPGEAHVSKHRNPIQRHLAHLADQPDPTIVNPRRLDQQRSAEVCGQCHSYASLPGGFYEGNWADFRAGKALDEHQQLFQNSPSPSSESLFWPDGSARTGGREYNAMVLSGCYTEGELTCVSCHDMHGDEPLDLIAADMNGDRSCVQCHADLGADIAAHTFHEPDSSGSRCLNCHMPYTSYALLGASRSHRISSPETSGVTSRDQPNACNLCHLDKTLAWTAGHLSERYGQPEPELSLDQVTVASSILWVMRGDAAQRTIAAWHMGQPWAIEASGDNWQPVYLARLLEDPYSAVRLIAHRSLVALTGDEQPFDYLGSEEHRRAVMRHYDASWRMKRMMDGDSAPPETLVGHAEQLGEDTIERLYSERDNRWLLISE
ncbi:MAG: cytochrome c3 family protein [Xanthomonadales bacterium]|nr:cytochrome c3 family protein [Xanthomonadales bacterium]